MPKPSRLGRDLNEAFRKTLEQGGAGEQQMGADPSAMQKLPDIPEAAVERKARTFGEAREGALAEMAQQEHPMQPAQMAPAAEPAMGAHAAPMTNADRNAAILKEVLMRKRMGLPAE